MMSNPSAENADTLSLSDLEGCGWELVLNAAPCNTYGRVEAALSSAAGEASRTERPRDEKALRLLAGIYSMMLTPDDRDHPFHPLWIWGERRSTLPEDFADDVPPPGAISAPRRRTQTEGPHSRYPLACET